MSSVHYLTHLARAGFLNPVITPVAADSGAPAAGGTGIGDLPEEWRLVRERSGESYQWPELHDRYSRYRVFIGATGTEGAVHLGLGETVRARWGRDRKYVVAFLSSGSPQKPLAEFVAADDYGRRASSWPSSAAATADGACTAPATCPGVYEERFRTALYSDRVVYPGAWNKIVVVAPEDEHGTMLNHALIQGRRRYPA